MRWLGVALMVMWAAPAFADVACPPGTTAEGAPPPDGYMLRCVQDGVVHGPWAMWYRSGAKAREGNMRHGELDGVQRSWHPNGVLASETRYRRGKPHGRWTKWFDNGKVRERTVFKNGLREDWLYEYHRDGGHGRTLYRGGLRDGVTVFRGRANQVMRYEFHHNGHQVHLPTLSVYDDCRQWPSAAYETVRKVRGVQKMRRALVSFYRAQCWRRLKGVNALVREYCLSEKRGPTCGGQMRALIVRDMARDPAWRKRLFELFRALVRGS